MQGAVAIEINGANSSVETKIGAKGNKETLELEWSGVVVLIAYLSIDFPFEKVEASVEAQDSS